MDRIEYQQIVEYLRRAQQSKYSEHDIKARFESVPAASYGNSMPRWLPDFEYTHQLLLESIALHLPADGTCVDLGAGTGRISQLLLEAFPHVHLILVDISTNMLREGERRLAKDADRCSFIIHDIFDPNLTFPANSLDCLVSVFAICHAQGREIYEQLYERIYRWLKPQGYFICYDHVLGDTASFTALNALGWYRFMCTNLSASDAESALISTYQEDSPLSLQQHLALLAAAGFSARDVLYKRDIFAIYAGIK